MGKEEKNTAGASKSGAAVESAPGADSLQQTNDDLQLQIEIKKEELQKLSEEKEKGEAELDQLRKSKEIVQSEYDQLSQKHDAKLVEFDQLQQKFTEASKVKSKAPEDEIKSGDVTVQFVKPSFRLNGTVYKSADVETAAAKGDTGALAVIAELVELNSGVIKIKK